MAWNAVKSMVENKEKALNT